MHTRRLIRSAAALLAIMLTAMLAAGCGEDTAGEQGAAATSADGGGASRSESQTQPDPRPVGDCSAAGKQIDLPEQPDLPRHVQQTREQLYSAAMRCDFEQLGMLAEGSADFSFSFGASTDPVEHWREFDASEQTLKTLATILAGPYREPSGRDDGYVWPAKDTLGYRTSIRPDGSWSYFIAGD